jgi:hypothetical protein
MKARKRTVKAHGGHKISMNIILKRRGNSVSLHSYSFGIVFVRNTRTFLYKYGKACLRLLWEEIHNLNINNHSPSPSGASAILYSSG